jgi:hypothetical protein
MEERLKAFLLKCGLNDGILTQLQKEDANLDELSTQFRKDLRDVVKNDPEFRSDIEASVKGKERASIERVAKRLFGITPEEAKEHGLGEDYEKLMEFARDKQKKDLSKTAQELQAQLQAANAEILKYKDEEIPRIRKEEQAKVDGFFRSNLIADIVSKSGELLVSPKAAAVIVNSYLSDNGYVQELTDDKRGLVIKTKDGLLPQNTEKTKNLTTDELVKSILMSEKLIRQSQAQPAPQGQPVPSQAQRPKPKFEPYGIKVARENEGWKPAVDTRK